MIEADRVTGPPSLGVIRAFGLAGRASPLGGPGRGVWQVSGTVLKSGVQPDEWQWLGENPPQVHPDGFRLAVPLPAVAGDWVVEGWGAQAALEGEHRTDRWPELLETSARLQRALKDLPRPPTIDRQTHPWARADRIAWAEAPAPAGHPALDALLALRRPLALPAQLVHADLGGNVLFAAGQPPAVIDFSPYWRPWGFASAVVLADAVCWEEGAPEPLLEAVQGIEEFPQLLLRALLFRMATTIEMSGEARLDGYGPGIDLVRQLCR